MAGTADHAWTADWTPGRALADRSAPGAQVAGRALAEEADHAPVVGWAPGRALADRSAQGAQVAGRAEVAAAGAWDGVWSDRHS
jgi:hypothetical protein